MNANRKFELDYNLPVAQYEDIIIEKLQNSNNIIIVGDTGSGKTTQIPLILINQFSDAKIVVTEPRRIAATSLCNYLSQWTLTTPGDLIGYKIRFEEKKSEKTKLLFATDGILLRECLFDPLLLKYDIIMVDEAHERGINTDFLIGLLVQIQNKRNAENYKPLKIIVTSATLEEEKFIKFFEENAIYPPEIIRVPGRNYDVDAYLLKEEVTDIYKQIVTTLKYLINNKIPSNFIYDQTLSTKGSIEDNGTPYKHNNVLIFLPGKREINLTKNIIQEQIRDIDVLTVHSELPIQEQNEIFKQITKTTAILATNIAETSLTIPNVKYIIDTGLIKSMEYDTNSGIKSLKTHYHSKHGILQRRGRAGRLCHGIYLGLFTKSQYNDFLEYSIPEILRSKLNEITLLLISLGIKEIENFHFIDKPKNSFIKKSIEELVSIGAITKKRIITDKGLKLLSMPLDPFIGNIILEAQNEGIVYEICTLIPLFDSKPLFYELNESILNKIFEKHIDKFNSQEELIDHIYRSRENIINPKSDYLTYIKLINRLSYHNYSTDWCDLYGVNGEALLECIKIRDDLLKLAEENNIHINKKINFYSPKIDFVLFKTLKHNLLIKIGKNKFRALNHKNMIVKINPSSILYHNANTNLLITNEIIQIDDIYQYSPSYSVRLAHAMDIKIIQKLSPKLYQKIARQKLNKKHRKFSVKNRKRYKNISRKKYRY